MFVIKRNGIREPVRYDKITSRVTKLSHGCGVVPEEITKRVIDGVHDGVLTSDIDKLASEVAASMTTIHPDYAIVAAKIEVSNLHKRTNRRFLDSMSVLYHYRNPETGNSAPLLNEKTWKVIEQHGRTLEEYIHDDRDMNFKYFGIKTLMRSYLLRCNGCIVERPQHMYMRVAVGIHGDDIKSVIETYNLLSLGYISHASPTMFNAGTPNNQFASCFLLSMKEDSIEGIYDTLKDCAVISKYAGGIGLSVNNIRASGSYISGTNGTGNGLVPMLRVFNATARYVDQGGNKRPGAFAIYIEPWHADIFSFIDLRKNSGMEESRARDLFYALWIPDLFMERVKADGEWTLMCPNECPGLSDCWGERFEELYTRYEKEGKGRETISAQMLWLAIIDSQIETGTPYMLYKDACNRKSNHQHMGTIKCSNLCTEIVEYTDKDHTAVCNLASINLKRYVKANGSEDLILDNVRSMFNFDLLHEHTKTVTKNLNRVIDVGYYPLKECETSNMSMRPIGIGVQGLADVFAILRVPFDSAMARYLNVCIFETMYHGAVEASIALAEKDGPYPNYEGSPFSRGLLQFDMWKEEHEEIPERAGVPMFSGMYDWQLTRDKLKIHGIRNSLLLAPMPTASTAQILGNTESIEMRTNNIYTRRVVSGEFQVVNEYLIRELEKLSLWNDDMRNEIIANNGSVQSEDVSMYPLISKIPKEIKNVFKTVWETSQKPLVDLCIDRGVFIDQSQSFNVHIAEPTIPKISSMHFYGWSRGMKTGMYYLRTKAAASAIQFTVDKSKLGQGCGDSCSA